MSDSNLIEKLSETITNTLKKTEVFEKIGKIEFYIGSFVILSSIIGLTNIYMNYHTTNKIKQLEEKLEGSENVLKYNIEINRKQLAICYNKIIEQLKNETSASIDTQQKITEKLMEIKVLMQNSKKDVISASTSVTSFSPIKSVNSMDDWKHNIIEQEEFKKCEDDELINECYDSIPLNNLKKNTGLSWLFK